MLPTAARNQGQFRAKDSPQELKTRARSSTFKTILRSRAPAYFLLLTSPQRGVGRNAIVTRKFLHTLILTAALAGLAGCSSVSQRAEEQRPFFQPEYQLTSHGRKTLFDRIVELDPGGLNVKVASDYQNNAPLRIAVLPFADRGSANFVVDKIPMSFRDHQQRVRWAWTDAQRLRRSMVGYLSGREFYVLNPIGIDAVLRARGITDEAKLEKVTPQKLGSWLGADAVVYGEILHYEAYYLALVSAWQVGIRGRILSTHDGEQLITFDGSRYDVSVMPALTPEDILINSAESLLQLRDIQLARSEEEVCRELVLRIPVSESLRLQIARDALETDAENENLSMPVSMTQAQQANTTASQPAHEVPPDESLHRVSVPDQPVNSIEIRTDDP